MAIVTCSFSNGSAQSKQALLEMKPKAEKVASAYVTEDGRKRLLTEIVFHSMNLKNVACISLLSKNLSILNNFTYGL